MRPSGKMTMVSPAFTALTMARAASGLVGSSRWALDDAQERAHPPGLRDLVVDGEARLLGQDGVQQRPVEQAHVVGGDDDALAGTGNVLEAGHLQPKKKLEHRAAGIAHDLRAPGVRDVGHGGDAEHAERGEQQGHADARRLQHRDDAARAHHVGRVEDVDGGDHARAPVHRGPRLHGRERGHDEQAAGDRQAAQGRRATPSPVPEASTSAGPIG